MSHARTYVEGLTFEEWYEEADRHVARLCGLGLDDLPDGPSWDAWHDGESPKAYARQQLEEEGFPF